jgi:hypothetical protein
MKPIELLKQTFEDTASAYVKLFCKKHDLEFQGWVGGIVGGFADCGDYNFQFHDITHDINTEQPRHMILAWYEIACKEAINYRAYTKVAGGMTENPTAMKALLIKLSEQHYIVVDDSEIREGDWIYKTNEPHKNAISISIGGAPGGWKRISKSFGASMGSLERSPLSEVEEAIYGYSFEKMANEKYHRAPGEYNEGKSLLCGGYSDGFMAAMELMKDKLFTVDDMINAYNAGGNSREDDINGDGETPFEEYIQSLLPPTQWDVEIDEAGKITTL